MKLTDLKILSLGVTLVLVSSCLGSDNSGTVPDGTTGDPGTQPFVEAYIEYPGPHVKWAGPQNFIAHILARGSGNAEVSISPVILSRGEPKKSVSSKTKGDHDVKAKEGNGISVESAREDLVRLNTALQLKEQSVKGCLSPVRVRLIRMDGTVVERQTCRGQSGWPHVASEIVSRIIENGRKSL